MTSDDPTAEATALLQDLIRNACVNDGRPESGEEIRSADLLTGYLAGAGLDVESYEPQPGRRSVLAKIEGSDPTAPSLLLMGHTDVVPVNADGWSRDPFGGEIVDGMVWGRGAVDMLNLTATMAVAFRRLADSGFKPKGTISYLAVADEEARGIWGADWLVDHELDDVKADYVITESGGFQVPTANGPRLPVMVEEKGTYWSKLTVRGTPGHASSPYRTDNALVTAAEVVRRLAEFQAPPELSGTWQRLVQGLGLPEVLLQEEGFRETDRPAAARARAHRVLVHAHDVRADGRARRHEDERHPRPGGHRGRHPDAARPERRVRAQDAGGGDRRPRATRSRSSPATTPRHARRSTRRSGTRSVG